MFRSTGLRWSLLFGCVVLCTYLPLARAQGKGGSDDKNPRLSVESFRGKWVQQSRTVNSKRLDDPAGVYLVVTDDGRMQSYSPVASSDGRGPTLVQHERFRLDLAKDPVTIDTAGKTDWTDVSRGICRLEDDSLTLCFAARNKPRPTEYSTGAGAGMGVVLVVYKRSAAPPLLSWVVRPLRTH
ncbi:MAG: TIGR03067 domain-containing protein [Planctomycetia bacterium]